MKLIKCCKRVLDYASSIMYEVRILLVRSKVCFNKVCNGKGIIVVWFNVIMGDLALFKSKS